jgi:hypothetical protein
MSALGRKRTLDFVRGRAVDCLQQRCGFPPERDRFLRPTTMLEATITLAGRRARTA